MPVYCGVCGRPPGHAQRMPSSPLPKPFSTDPNSSGLRHMPRFTGEAACTSLIEVSAFTYEI